jgi:hypothetical protein
VNRSIKIPKQKKAGTRHGNVPDDAVLLIPEPERQNDTPPYGVKPGYYNSKQLLQLVEEHKSDPEAIQFIADMLETGDPENDEFAVMLRTNRHDPNALARIVKICEG